jgi:hypothetical protein
VGSTTDAGWQEARPSARKSSAPARAKASRSAFRGVLVAEANAIIRFWTAGSDRFWRVKGDRHLYYNCGRDPKGQAAARYRINGHRDFGQPEAPYQSLPKRALTSLRGIAILNNERGKP